MSLTRSGLAVLLLLLPAVGCSRSREDSQTLPSATAPAPKKPVDRLSKDELAPGGAEVFGFEIPRQMQVEHHYKDSVHLIGKVTPEALANYVKDRVTVQHVEVGAARTIFPNARIRRGPKDRLYQLEVLPDRFATKLIIHDVTPPTAVPGLSEAERWRRAGMTPEGRPLDPKSLE